MPGRDKTRVELLWFEDCPNHMHTEVLIRGVAADLGLDITIERRLVADMEAARRLRFPGSPTVRIDGVDVEPGFNEPVEGFLGCRVYSTPGGLRGTPETRWIRDAIVAQRT